MRYLSWIVVGMLAVAMFAVGCKTSPHNTAAPAPSPAAITLKAGEASCPVLGTIMKKSEMIPVDYKGKTYYLCCQGCVGPFNADPQKYIDHPATPKNGM